MSSASESRGLTPAFGISLLAFCMLTGVAQAAKASAVSDTQEVELTLRIHPGPGDRRLEQYVVELRNSSDHSLRIVDAMSGGKIAFKHLKPDIYRACIHGTQGSKHCTSIDIFPPEGSQGYKLTSDVAGPSSTINSTNRYTVKIGQLQTPEKARQELLHSLQAAIRGDSQEEITHLQRAIEIDPAYVDALNNLGFYYLQAGNRTLAIQYLRRVTELDPEFHTGWANLAGALSSLGQWQEALRVALHGLTLRPDSASSNSQTALCYYQMHRYPEAEKYFKKSLDLDPAAGTFPMLYLARIALMDHREEDAEAWIRVCLRVHPNHPDTASWREALQKLETGSPNKEPAVASQNQRQQ